MNKLVEENSRLKEKLKKPEERGPVNLQVKKPEMKLKPKSMNSSLLEKKEREEIMGLIKIKISQLKRELTDRDD